MKMIEIRAFFEGRDLPKSLNIDSIGLIFDVPLFVHAHLETLTQNSGNKAFLPHYDRLMRFVNYLIEKEKNGK